MAPAEAPAEGKEDSRVHVETSRVHATAPEEFGRRSRMRANDRP